MSGMCTSQATAVVRRVPYRDEAAGSGEVLTLINILSADDQAELDGLRRFVGRLDDPSQVSTDEARDNVIPAQKTIAVLSSPFCFRHGVAVSQEPQSSLHCRGVRKLAT